MKHNTGLTVVDHIDLKHAVRVWKSYCDFWEELNEKAVDYMTEKHYAIPKFKRYYYNLKRCDWLGPFPLITIHDTSGKYYHEYRNKFGEDFSQVFEYKEWLINSKYRNKYSDIAQQCASHNGYDGKHYLNADQVEFVTTFKNLKMMEVDFERIAT